MDTTVIIAIIIAIAFVVIVIVYLLRESHKQTFQVNEKEGK